MLKEKNIIVVGGVGKLGRQIVHHLNQSEAKTIVLDICTFEEFKEKKIDCDKFQQCTINDKYTLERIIKKIRKKYSKIDVKNYFDLLKFLKEDRNQYL